MTKYILLITILLSSHLSAQQTDNLKDSIEYSNLQEIVVTAVRTTQSSTNNIGTASVSLLNSEIDGDLSRLNAVSGVYLTDVGSGMAKLNIRGFSGTRVAVVSNGVKLQNQQWGSDHGLQLDLAEVQSVSIERGASSLMYGSDGIGGALVFAPKSANQLFRTDGQKTRNQNTLAMLGESNNRLLNYALQSAINTDNFYASINYLQQDFSDSKLATGQFGYDGETFSLYKNRLSNTAGRERVVGGALGFRAKELKTIFNISNNYQKMGLFAATHGHIHQEDIDYDSSFRNIAMPYSRATHLVASNRTEWENERLLLQVDLAYQQNNRKEFEEHHDHDDHDDDHSDEQHGEGGISLKLKTYSFSSKLFVDRDRSWQKTVGFDFERQNNTIGGEEFYLPAFQQTTGGLYVLSKYAISRRWSIDAGLRYDLAKINVEENLENDISKLKKTHHSYSGALSAKYQVRNIQTSTFSQMLGLGRSFRFPTASELAANGFHHGAFRHELGNPDLKAETGYTLNSQTNYSHHKLGLDVQLNLFASYYPNFIFLEALNVSDQTYQYQQGKVWSGGFEYQIDYLCLEFGNKSVSLSTGGAYVLNKNTDADQYLAFIPPFTMNNEISLGASTKGRLTHYSFGIRHSFYAEQNKIAEEEVETPSANLFHLFANMKYKVSNKIDVNIGLDFNNIFNTQYYNHLSYYRRFGLAEKGRNVKLKINIPFSL